MTTFVSPAAIALWGKVVSSGPVAFGPILLSGDTGGLCLRQRQDQSAVPASLRCVPLDGLRALSQSDASGRFRPNKASPNLVGGWIHIAADAAALDAALEALLPGGLEDWYSVEKGSTRTIPWQQYADRQTGMYRHVAAMNDPEAEEVARAGCHSRCCTRRRMWTVGENPPEIADDKSCVPCLEPCALLLELARRAQKTNTADERSQIVLTESDLVTLDTLFGMALDNPDVSLREGDFSAPGNPRRILLLREKLLPWLPAKTAERPS